MRKSAKKGVQFSPVDRFLRTDVLTWDMLGARLTHRRRTPATCRFTWGLLGGRCTPRLGGSAAAPDSVRRARDSPAHAQNCQKKRRPINVLRQGRATGEPTCQTQGGRSVHPCGKLPPRTTSRGTGLGERSTHRCGKVRGAPRGNRLACDAAGKPCRGHAPLSCPARQAP